MKPLLHKKINKINSTIKNGTATYSKAIDTLADTNLALITKARTIAVKTNMDVFKGCVFINAALPFPYKLNTIEPN